MTSPFDWQKNRKPSIFANDIHFKGSTKAIGEATSRAIKDGRIASTLTGLSKKSDERIAKQKSNKAKKDKQSGHDE